MRWSAMRAPRLLPYGSSPGFRRAERVAMGFGPLRHERLRSSLWRGWPSHFPVCSCCKQSGGTRRSSRSAEPSWASAWRSIAQRPADPLRLSRTGWIVPREACSAPCSPTLVTSGSPVPCNCAARHGTRRDGRTPAPIDPGVRHRQVRHRGAGSLRRMVLDVVSSPSRLRTSKPLVPSSASTS